MFPLFITITNVHSVCACVYLQSLSFMQQLNFLNIKRKIYMITKIGHMGKKYFLPVSQQIIECS